jgi:hypothetical protein
MKSVSNFLHEARRDWVRVKRQRTADCVVIGVAGDNLKPALVWACDTLMETCTTSALRAPVLHCWIPVHLFSS